MPVFKLRIERDYRVEMVITHYKDIEVEAATLEDAWDEGKEACFDTMEAEDWDNMLDEDFKHLLESEPAEEDVHLLHVVSDEEHTRLAHWTQEELEDAFSEPSADDDVHTHIP